MVCRPMSKPITPLRGLTPTLCSCSAVQLPVCRPTPTPPNDIPVQATQGVGPGRDLGGIPGVTGGSPGEVGFPDGTGFGDVVGLPGVNEGVGVTGLVGLTAGVGLTR